jgi:hypothetical protein
MEQVEGEDDTVFFRGDDALYQRESGKPPRVYFDKHLYQPLVTQEDDIVQYSPPGLNTGERQFVEYLRGALHGERGSALLSNGRELYVLRNASRGTGVGFQTKNGGRFFPDFILWLVEEEKQHIIFVDPKGLDVALGNIDTFPKVQFCQNIGTYEDTLRKRTGREDVHLHAFLLSRTSFQRMKEKQGLSRQDFAQRKVYFLEDGASGVWNMLDDVIEG